MLANFFGRPIALSETAFLFVFCPNNSGKTVLSQYIAEQTGSFIPSFGNNEGQEVPSVRPMMRNDAWNPNSVFDWKFIRSEWEKLSGRKRFVEASPPNMIRVDEMALVFGEDSSAVLSICDPYQHIASCLRAYHKPGTDPVLLVPQWVAKARKLAEIQQKFPQFPLFRYDDYVDRPWILNEYFDVPILESRVRGKEASGMNAMANMRAVTTLFLTEDELDHISAQLERFRELVHHFGYEVSPGAEIIAELSSDDDALIVARKRRSKWSQQQAREA